jgi:hypothetical protein
MLKEDGMVIPPTKRQKTGGFCWEFSEKMMNIIQAFKIK